MATRRTLRVRAPEARAITIYQRLRSGSDEIVELKRCNDQLCMAESKAKINGRVPSHPVIFRVRVYWKDSYGGGSDTYETYVGSDQYSSRTWDQERTYHPPEPPPPAAPEEPPPPPPVSDEEAADAVIATGTALPGKPPRVPQEYIGAAQPPTPFLLQARPHVVLWSSGNVHHDVIDRGAVYTPVKLRSGPSVKRYHILPTAPEAQSEQESYRKALGWAVNVSGGKLPIYYGGTYRLLFDPGVAAAVGLQFTTVGRPELPAGGLASPSGLAGGLLAPKLEPAPAGMEPIAAGPTDGAGAFEASAAPAAPAAPPVTAPPGMEPLPDAPNGLATAAATAPPPRRLTPGRVVAGLAALGGAAFLGRRFLFGR